MLVTADQLVCHLIGDYVIQSDWMATEKTKRLWPAFVHAVSYSIPFWFIIDWDRQPWALFVIVLSHAVIDHWRLARHVCWGKNLASPAAFRHPWTECVGTGYHRDRPAWLAVWLMIITDNVMHVLINAAALRWL